MPERILILVLILTTIFFLVRKYFSSTITAERNFVKNIPGIDTNFPTIIYFWSEYCRACFTRQNPVLSELKKSDRFNLVSFDAVNEEELVKEFNIKTVPATVVISSGEGEVKFINNGYAGEKLLSSQLQEAS